jgi:ketosteroid isomerase-like protein
VSQENVDIARRAMQGDYAAGFELASPAMKLELGPGVTPVGMAPVYEGHEGLRQFRSLLFDVYEHYESEIEDVKDSGDDVLVVFRERGIGRLSGVRVDRRLHTVLTMKGGKIVRSRTYLDEAEALKAVGQEE